MRSLLVAAALCLPALGSAQAVHSGVSHTVAIMDAPAFAFQAGAVRAAMPRTFSGIIKPVRLTDLQLAPGTGSLAAGEVVVEYTVNTAGVPEDIHVVKPLARDADKAVIEAVRRVRYTPGQLDGQPVATPVTLHVALSR